MSQPSIKSICYLSFSGHQRVRFLTVSFACLLLTLNVGCAWIKPPKTIDCNNRAILRVPLEELLAERFELGAQVRMAVVPFSTPPNMPGTMVGYVDPGVIIASEIQREILHAGVVPIVEVFNRTAWPRKREEFYTGNFGAISRARAAGYDLLLVGELLPTSGMSQVRLLGKLISVSDGVTVWFGETAAESTALSFGPLFKSVYKTREVPNETQVNHLMAEVSSCLVTDLLNEEPVPF